MSDRPLFTLSIDQNEHLPAGGREVHAILTVEASGPALQPAGSVEAAEVIIVDASGSMGGPKIAEARRAAQVAVETLRDGVHFAVVAGTHEAAKIYPSGRAGLARADAGTREQAARALRGLNAGGGTSIGAWLRLAAELLQDHPGAVRHAILLTDGQNNEDERVFAAALAHCAGRFVCDCRGVGTDWKPAELRRVAEALLGGSGFIRDPGDLADDFRAMVETTMGKAVAEVALRIWTPQHGRVKYLKQVSPALADLTGLRADVDALTGDYPTGAWGAETREYHLCVEIPPGAVGQEVRGAWVRLVVPDAGTGEPGGPGDILARGNVLARWTDDLALSTRVSPGVAHYTGQAELFELIQEGLGARAAGDLETATARLGRARELAEESGNTDTAKLLAKVVEVDPGTGTARLRRTVDRADEIALDTGSVRTARIKKEPGPGGRDAAS
ncbi:VWA domain-containing protein [Planomonospora parontospora subsp. parontospora]|uniref:VWA domain-containing protein n=2 Tax=Planomonospora parontospora TaxID=58119 RepID=A0AA37F2F9_9ACTN|nr:VWA domain-containing protein [Planomonospora parontospora]GGK49151.1 VWA domain-containing protein [Planomonospora parontospora]GII12431.1 VWA domain-containing protein [Planomonospora parontospora subsp. parontospora]